jgi:pyruvate kinase
MSNESYIKKFEKTKIIATLGPSTDTVEKIRELIRSGANCFRINFSHGDGEKMMPVILNAREASHLENVHIPILADIQGPKLRIGKVPKEGIVLKEGAPFTITTRKVEGSAEIVHSPYEYLSKDVKPGNRILLADGTLELVVESVDGDDVHCKVINGGILFSNKGINLPNAKLTIETLTEKDRRDLEFASQEDLDIVAISFVRTADDIEKARGYLGGKKIPVMAKLERIEALDNLNSILEASDGVMIARGDLGVEIEFERVPLIQKQILQRAAVRGKWTVVATQMLGSMVVSSRPSRAEVSDVANAVLDGADAVMLSEETAAGNHPVLAVQAMRKISRHSETLIQHSHVIFEEDIVSFSAGAAGAAVSAAERINAKAIITLAGSKTTALLISKWRPNVPVLALSWREATLRRLNVLRGVVPIQIDRDADMEAQMKMADRYLIQNEWAVPGDAVIVTAAIPLGEGKETNTVRFHRVRDVLSSM